MMFSDGDFEIDEDFLNDPFKINVAGNLKRPNEDRPNGNNILQVINTPTSPSRKLNLPSSAANVLSSLPTHAGPELYTPPTKMFRASSSKSFTSAAVAAQCITPKSSSGTKVQYRQRMFPGPAGLLPDKPEHLNRSLDLTHTGSKSVCETTPTSPDWICSQTTGTNFLEGPWKKLSDDFDLEDASILAIYSVDWIKKRTIARQLPGKKVPFLPVVIKSMNFKFEDPAVVFEDETGPITGTLHRKVVAAYSAELKPGSALALHQVGVVSTSVLQRQTHLNITLKNVISIYDLPSENSKDVRVTVVNAVSQKQLADSIVAYNELEASENEPNVNLGNDDSAALLQDVKHVTGTVNIPRSSLRDLIFKSKPSVRCNSPTDNNPGPSCSSLHGSGSALFYGPVLSATGAKSKPSERHNSLTINNPGPSGSSQHGSGNIIMRDVVYVGRIPVPRTVADVLLNPAMHRNSATTIPASTLQVPPDITPPGVLPSARFRNVNSDNRDVSSDITPPEVLPSARFQNVNSDEQGMYSERFAKGGFPKKSVPLRSMVFNSKTHLKQNGFQSAALQDEIPRDISDLPSYSDRSHPPGWEPYPMPEGNVASMATIKPDPKPAPKPLPAPLTFEEEEQEIVESVLGGFDYTSLFEDF